MIKILKDGTLAFNEIVLKSIGNYKHLFHTKITYMNHLLNSDCKFFRE